jgi:hypothetical protein
LYAAIGVPLRVNNRNSVGSAVELELVDVDVVVVVVEVELGVEDGDLSRKIKIPKRPIAVGIPNNLAFLAVAIKASLLALFLRALIALKAFAKAAWSSNAFRTSSFMFLKTRAESGGYKN